jgi:hypothetical protein
MVGVIKFMLRSKALESLRKVYAQEKYLLEHFSEERSTKNRNKLS